MKFKISLFLVLLTMIFIPFIALSQPVNVNQIYKLNVLAQKYQEISDFYDNMDDTDSLSITLWTKGYYHKEIILDGNDIPAFVKTQLKPIIYKKMKDIQEQIRILQLPQV